MLISKMIKSKRINKWSDKPVSKDPMGDSNSIVDYVRVGVGCIGGLIFPCMIEIETK